MLSRPADSRACVQRSEPEWVQREKKEENHGGLTTTRKYIQHAAFWYERCKDDYQTAQVHLDCEQKRRVWQCQLNPARPTTTFILTWLRNVLFIPSLLKKTAEFTGFWKWCLCDINLQQQICFEVLFQRHYFDKWMYQQDRHSQWIACFCFFFQMQLKALS